MDINYKGILNTPFISEVGITDGLIGWWPMNGNSKDYTKNRKDAINVGATIGEGLGQLSYGLNGSSSYFNLGNNNLFKFPNLPFTFVIWIKTTFQGVTRSIIFFTEGMTLTFNVRIGQGKVSASGGGATISNPSNIADGEWHMLTIGYKDGKLFLYTDKNLIGESNTTKTIQFGGDLIIGSEVSRQYFQGNIQNIRVYNKALNENEVAITYDIAHPNEAKMKIDHQGNIYIKGQLKEV